MNISNKQGVALLSFAHRHQYKWLETFQKNPNIEVTGIWDDNEIRGKTVSGKHQIPFFKDLKTLLSLKMTTGVAICSEPSKHLKLIDQCCLHKVHILCEKPLAPSIEEGYRIKELIDRSGVLFFQSFPQRLIPSNIRIKQLLDSGAIGNITHIRKRHGHSFGLKNLENDMPWIVDGKKRGEVPILMKEYMKQISFSISLACQIESPLSLFLTKNGQPTYLVQPFILFQVIFLLYTKPPGIGIQEVLQQKFTEREGRLFRI